MFLKIIGSISSDLGIDLGTANTIIYARKKGIILSEPSVVALDIKTGKVFAIGDEAKLMIGRTPGNIRVVRPLKDGVIADFKVAEAMIKSFIRKVHKRKSFIAPRIIVCVPSGATSVERRAIKESAELAGGREVYLIEEPMAAAIGSGVDVTEARGRMIVDIGGGTTEVAVISLGGIVYSKSVRIGGDKMDDSVIQYVRKAFNLLIGESTAEKVKVGIGSARPTKESESISISVKGRSLLNGIPEEVSITQTQVAEALKEAVEGIIQAVRDALESTPPELSGDIIEDGVILTGGGALVHNLDVVLSEETGIKFMVAENALNCVAIGTGKVLDDVDKLQKILKNCDQHWD